MAGTAEISGVGFAGLTAAIRLASRGWRVRMHEREDDLRAFGAGIFLWENGLRVLAELGLERAVLSRAHTGRQWEERTADAVSLGARPLPLPGGLRMVTLTRKDLFDVLLRAARDAGVEIRTGSPVVGADADGVLRTADGGSVRADLVLGADGIRSAVRLGLGLPTEHERFPFGLYRFLVPLERAPAGDDRWRRDYVNCWNLALRRRVLYVPCNDRDLYLLLGAVDDDPALALPLDPQPWCASFPELRRTLSELPDRPRFDRYELVRVAAWSSGRAAIVGDAAHAMPPTLGQGAGTAMLNAFDLASAITDTGDVPAALRDWEAAARPETERAQDESAAIARDLFPHGDDRRDDWSSDAVRLAGNRPQP